MILYLDTSGVGGLSGYAACAANPTYDSVHLAAAESQLSDAAKHAGVPLLQA